MADPYDINSRPKRGTGFQSLDWRMGGPAATRDPVATDPAPAKPRNPSDYLQGSAPPVMGAQAFDAAGFRALAGKPKPTVAPNQFGDVTHTSDTVAAPNPFADVVGHTDTVAATDPNHQFNAAPPQLEAAQARYGNLMPRGITGNTRAAEDERQKALGSIDSAMFAMGPANMASKRRMVTELLDQKNHLTSQAYDTQNRRDIAGADMANDAAKQDAALQESGAKRRDDIASFNKSEADKLYESDAAIQEKRDAREAALPFDKMKMRLLNIQANALDSKARIEDDNNAIGRDQKLNAGAEARRQAYLKLHPGDEPGADAYNASLELEGTSPASPVFRRTVDEQGNALEAVVNSGQGKPLLTHKTIPSDRAGTTNPNDYEFKDVGGLQGAFNWLGGHPESEVNLRGNPDASAIIPRSQVDAIKRLQNQLQRRSGRQKADDQNN